MKLAAVEYQSLRGCLACYYKLVKFWESHLGRPVVTGEESGLYFVTQDPTWREKSIDFLQ